MKDFLAASAGRSFSARMVSSSTKIALKSASRELRRMGAQGEIRYETRVEFDYEPNRKFGLTKCRRRRNYYWVDGDVAALAPPSIWEMHAI